METVVEAELCFPQLNTSCQKYKVPQMEVMLINTVLSCISLLTVVLNLLVIISISHFRQLHTPTNLLLLSLAVSDFLVGLLVIPFQMLLSEPCWLHGDLLCVLYFFIPYITVSASIVSMVLISVDRYVAICDPMRYPIKFTQKRVNLCVLLGWLYCVLYSFMILYNDLKHPGMFSSCYGECVININWTVDILLSFILPISIIIILYVRVFIVAVSQARSMRCHVAAVKLQRSLKSELKAARTLGIVIAAFIMCYSPYYFSALIGQHLTITASNNLFMAFLVYLNSCLNPVIYAFFYPWFRKCVKLIVMLDILQPQSRQANVM